MKTTNIKYAVMLICGVMAACGILNSCKLDEPEPTPQEELFLREFIKKYGLIDPNQDWNQAVQAKVTIRVAYAKDINLFVKVADMYYRVASYAEVYDEVVIPVDVPEGTDKIFVDIDGRFFTTTPGGVVDATRAKAPSRADYGTGWQKYQWPYRRSVVVPVTNIDCSVQQEQGVVETDIDGITIDKQTITYDWVYAYIKNKGVLDNAVGTTTGISNTSKGTEVYFQLYVPAGANPNYMLRFTTNTSNASTLYVAVFSGGGTIYLSQTIDISGEQTHELPIFNLSGGTGGNYYQMVIKVVDTTLDSASAGDWSNISIKEFNPQNMAWLLVAEDLGATDDFDFNDVIIRIEAVNVNAPKLAVISLDNKWWQVVEDDDEHMVLGPSSAPSRAGSRAAGYTTLRISAMCAGGTLDSYLHFATGSKDFVLEPNSEPLDLTTATPTTDYTEWHSWFTGRFSEGEENSRDMLNTGLNDATGLSAEIVVPDNFSMTNYSVLYKDYDGDPDDFDALGKYNHDNGNKTGWQYDIDPATDNDLIQGFYITVGGPTKDNCNTILTAPIAGRAPQMFLIPDVGSAGYWKWPRERVPITNVYPRFSKWVKGTDADWYLDTPPTSAQTHEDRTVNPPVISLVRN